MENFSSEDKIKQLLEEIVDSKKPTSKRIAFLFGFLGCIALGFFISELLYNRYRRDIDDVKQKTSDEIKFTKRLADEEISTIKKNADELLSQKEFHYLNSQNLIIDKYDNRLDQVNVRLQQIIIDNARSEANHIIEMADLLNYVPDSIASFFNTFPKDRPFLQLSNASKYLLSNKSYSFAITAEPQDTIALYFYIHNTSGNYAIQPIIDLKYQQVEDTLISFSGSLLAKNTNNRESGSAFLKFRQTNSGKKLFGFNVIWGGVYESRERTSRRESVRVIYYPMNLIPNIKMSLGLSDIPPINYNEENLYEDHFSVVLSLVPVYY